MATTAVVTDAVELATQRLGYIAISMTEWTTTAKPAIAAGSTFECAGSLYYCSANEDPDPAAAWGGLAAGMVYQYFNPSTLLFYVSSTAPAWDTAKQGNYLGASPTHRCLARYLKSGAGLWEQKAIFIDRVNISTYGDDTAYGTNALSAATMRMGNNTAYGKNALAATTGGTYDTAVGANALAVNTGSAYNTAVGANAFAANSGGVSGTAIGAYALQANTNGTHNTATGANALYVNTIGSTNTAVGANSLITNISGNASTAVGYQALYNSTGGGGTAVGHSALFATSTGINNTACGKDCLSNITTGGNNSGLGYLAQASAVNVSNEITLGNSSVGVLRCQVALTVLSDERDKDDIEPIKEGVGFIEKLKPVKYRWNKRIHYAEKDEKGIVKTDENGYPVLPKEKGTEHKDEKYSVGITAQNLKQAMDESGADHLRLVYESNPEILETTPENLIPVLVNAIKELSARVKELEKSK